VSCVRSPVARLATAAFAVAAFAGGCTPERVEYRPRPDLSFGEQPPEEFIAPDGTRVVFVDPGASGADGERLAASAAAGGGKKAPPAFEPRAQLDDGTVVLRCLMPQHVVGNAMTCFRNEEWRLMWDQLLADDSRATYERPGGGGFAAFEAWCIKNRRPAMELLNRMRFDAMGSDVVMRPIGRGVTRATLTPHLWDQFGLRVVEFEQTPQGMRLRSIRATP
jgi:hypothetical protein